MLDKSNANVINVKIMWMCGVMWFTWPFLIKILLIHMLVNFILMKYLLQENGNMIYSYQIKVKFLPQSMYFFVYMFRFGKGEKTNFIFKIMMYSSFSYFR